MERATFPVITVAPGGDVVQLNTAAATLLGRPREELLGRPATEILAGPDGGPVSWAPTADPLPVMALCPNGRRIPSRMTIVSSGEEPPSHTAFLTAPSRMERMLADAERLAQIGSWGLDLRTRDATWSDELYRIHGLAPQSIPASIELLLDHVHPEDRDRIAALLAGVADDPSSVPPAGVEFAYRALRPDGSVRDMRALGRVERDAQGRAARWVGSAQDISELRLTERELHAHYAVSVALRDWESFDEGVVRLLERLGNTLDYQCGALWTWDADRERLICRAFWSGAAAGGEPTAFEDATRAMEFIAGEGAPGRAYAQHRPVIAEELAADPSFGRPAAARALGLTSGAAFPATDGDDVLAVLTFYSTDRRAPTRRLERTLTGIGRELGRFLLRRRAQLHDRRLSARELQVLRLATEGFSGPEIAERLVVSPSTIKTHFEHIYEKLGVGDRAAAVALALRTGIIE
jgi:PAS domain S-box-containing protein